MNMYNLEDYESDVLGGNAECWKLLFCFLSNERSDPTSWDVIHPLPEAPLSGIKMVGQAQSNQYACDVYISLNDTIYMYS